MPIGQNRHYNDPALGSAFASLAQVFAPPSGGDLAGYAAAQAKREEAQRLADLFAQGTTPSERAALVGVQNYGQTPQGFTYNVDQGNLTTRRGQDVSAQTALTANAADNVRALEQTRLGNTKDITTSLLTPVGENATRFVPPSVAEMFGLPATQGGNIAAAPGERITTPDGRVIEGAAKPLSETELEAQIKQRLMNEGSLSDQMLLDSILGERTPVKVVGADGKPMYKSPGAAVREGATPFDSNPSGERVDNYLAAGPNGEEIRFLGYIGPDNQIYNTADGKPVPNVVRKEGTGGGMSVEVGPDGSVKMSTGTGKSTEAQDRNAFASSMTKGATEDILKAFDNGTLPNGTDYQLFQGMRMLPMAAHPALVSQMSPQGQLFYQNVRTALPYQLMSQSGQAVTEQEYERKLLELVPIPGEDPSVTAGKRRQFEEYQKIASRLAGSAYSKAQGAGSAPGATAAPKTTRMKFDAQGNPVQ